MQAGLPHRTRCRPLIIHLAPKTSTDQLPIRPATQNRPKAACAPPASPASRDSPLASPPEQSRPVASTLDRLGCGANQPAVRSWGRGLPRRGAERVPAGLPSRDTPEESEESHESGPSRQDRGRTSRAAGRTRRATRPAESEESHVSGPSRQGPWSDESGRWPDASRDTPRGV